MTPTAYATIVGIAVGVASLYFWGYVGNRYFEKLERFWDRHWSNGVTSMILMLLAFACNLAVIGYSATGTLYLAGALA